MKTIKLILVVTILTLGLNAYSQSTNKALYFDNQNTNIKNSSVYFGSANYNFTDKLTICVWVKWNAKPDSLANNEKYKWGNIVSITNATYNNVDNGQFWLQHSSSNTYFEFAVKAGSNRQYMLSKTKPVAGKWYYLSAVYNGSASDTTMKLYVNGVLETSYLKSTISGNIINFDSRNRMSIGRIPGGFREFVGFMDEMRIWKRDLTTDEIVKQMYSQETINSNGLASYYDFNATQGAILPDLGPSGFNGKYYKELITVYNYSSSAPVYTITDSIKTWSTNSFAGLNLKTLSGAGIDENNTVVSNTANTIVLQNALATAPVLNGNTNMTMIGIESAASENSMWVNSLAPLNNGSLNSLYDLAGNWNANASNFSSILTLSNTNIVSDENVVFGHNNMDLTFSSSDVPVGASSRINRTWKFQTNKVNGLTGKIEIDFSTIDVPNVASLKLVVTTSSSSFTGGSVLNGTISGTKFVVNSASIPNGAFISLGSVDSPLPVEMESFTYSLSKRNVTLNWKTSKEINNNGFDVERSIANGKFEKVTFVKGNGNTNNTKEYSYTDANLNTGKYKYRLKQTDYNGNFEYHILSGEVNVGVPAKFELSQNYPNPFNPATKIDFSLPVDSKVNIKLYDISGKEVMNILSEQKSAGFHTVNINASVLSSGTYFYQINAVGTDGKNFTTSKKMILSK